jgi:ribose transport system permease protein
MRRLSAPSVPLVLIAGSLLAFAATAIGTHSNDQLTWTGLAGLIARMVALGIVALGQTFVILGRSIDLSVAQVISVAAVMASFVMQGRVEMIGPAVTLVLAVSLLVGLVNGLLVVRARVNPFIATLGVGLCLQGVLSAAFTDFAGSVPRAFQVLAYGSAGGLPLPILLLLLLTALCWFGLEHTRFGAHLYAVGGNAEGARQAGIHTGRVLIAAHVICSVLAGLTGLYLAARLRSGAPWIGRDGVYDLQSIAVAVIGGTLLSGGRGGVIGSVAGARCPSGAASR